MKVLWFSNTSSLYSFNSGEISTGTGNWISSLERMIRNIPDLELGVAFHMNRSTSLVVSKKDNVTYFILPSKYKTKSGKLFNNWFGKVDNEFEIAYYYKVIEQFNPDVIQIFGFENSFVKVLPRYKHKTIIHIQGISNVILHFLHGNFKTLELSNATSFINKIKGRSYKSINKRFKERAIIESYAFRQCEYLFGRTEWDKRVSSVVAPQAKYFHCHEIMREAFYETTWDKTRAEEIVIYSTIIDNPFKAPDQIFQVDRILQEYDPKLKYIWRISGLNETSLCVRAMRNRGYSRTERIHLLGRLSAREIVREMQLSDLFVYPSFIENGCNAVQEAMLLGMPIVCTSAGGMATTISNNETGLLVQPGDPYALAGAILDLIKDYKLAKKLGYNARSLAEKRHNKEDIVNTVYSTYKIIANNGCII